MRVTLTFDGHLPAASRGDPRSREKNKIRRSLCPQLEKIFNTHPALGEGKCLNDWRSLPEDQKYLDDPDRLLDCKKIGRYAFIPLVTRRHFMICELSLLFLRREEPGALVHNGDIDNRLKVLFDGLRMPREDSELKGLGEIEPDPFYCLLADDSLITTVNLRTEQWFEPPAQDKNITDIRLIIDVNIRVTKLTWGNMALGG